MRCPVCSFDNRAAARFCGQCGRPLGGVVKCPSCASQNSAAQKHCDHCGHSLARAAEPAGRDLRAYTPAHLRERILTSRSALEDERKQVTVLFADVKGSMDLAEQVDPEEWHKIMGRFFAILSEGGRARRKFGGNSGLVGEGRDDEVSGRDGSAHLVVQA